MFFSFGKQIIISKLCVTFCMCVYKTNSKNEKKRTPVFFCCNFYRMACIQDKIFRIIFWCTSSFCRLYRIRWIKRHPRREGESKKQKKKDKHRLLRCLSILFFSFSFSMIVTPKMQIKIEENICDDLFFSLKKFNQLSQTVAYSIICAK